MSQKEVSEEDLKNMSAEEIAELQKQNCIFCKIASKEIPAKIIHEDSDTICILDINPASEGHILVYPKKHYMIMPHVPEEILAKIFKNVKLMSQTLLKSLQCKGTTVFVANGMAAGQKAPHVLIHVFPRRENDGLVKLPSYEMSDEQIEKLKHELQVGINHIFGIKKRIVKEAEFTDVKEEKPKHATHTTTKIEKHSKNDDVDSDNETTLPEDNSANKDKKDSTRKPEKEKDKNEGPKKVDLDDIAKLFGG